MSGRCSELSSSAGERLAGTATNAERWLLLEVPGPWPREVSAAGVLPQGAHTAVDAWLADGSSGPRRLLVVRRPGPREGSVAFVIRADGNGDEVRRIQFADHEDLAGLDFDRAGDLVAWPLVLVCGHGSRDACCALRGTAVFGALLEGLGEEQLWISSHQGGHRFAANVLALPLGLQFGRVEVEEAPSLVARAIAGFIALDRYRGRTFYPPRVQAAEHALRSATGLDRVDDLALVHTAADGHVVRFRASDGREHEAFVDPAAGPVTPASCGARPEAQAGFTARVR